jgi:hypothetical protein
LDSGLGIFFCWQAIKPSASNKANLLCIADLRF